jgi:outer membrane protein assembly factor BamE (lipoprotein component of BamABCDE complex)
LFLKAALLKGRSLKNLIMIACVSVVLAGCASAGNQALKDQSEATVSQKLTRGVSTKVDVKKAFGDPEDVSFTDSGNEIWHYSYAKAQAKAENFIPYYNIFKSGADVNKTTLVVLFDKQGVVTTYTIANSKEEVNRGLLSQ